MGWAGEMALPAQQACKLRCVRMPRTHYTPGRELCQGFAGISPQILEKLSANLRLISN